jgi:hypothetical protein
MRSKTGPRVEGTSLPEITAHRRHDVENPAAVGLEHIHQTLEIGGVGRYDAAVAPVLAAAVNGKAAAAHHDSQRVLQEPAGDV